MFLIGNINFPAMPAQGRQGVQWTAYRNASLNPTRAKNLPRTIGSPYEQCKSSKLKASGKVDITENPNRHCAGGSNCFAIAIVAPLPWARRVGV